MGAVSETSRRGLLKAWIECPPWWLVVLVCGAILVVRKFDVVVNPQFWGEDGPNFYRDAILSGWRAFPIVYASYLHAVPRVVGALASVFHPRWAPTVFVTCAFALTLYVALRTQSGRSPLPRNLAVAAAVVCIPDGFEVLLNITNLQWVIVSGLLLVLISRDPETWPQKLHDAVATLLLGLTGPFSIAMGPLFLWRAVQRRSRWSTVLAALACGTAAVQAWTILHYPPGKQELPVDLGALLAVPGMRLSASLLVGAFTPADFPRVIEIALAVLALGAVVFLATRKGPARPERLLIGAFFVGLLGLTLFRCRYVLPDLCRAGYGSRYFYPLQLMLVWLLLFAAADTGLRRRWILGAVLGWALLINLPRLREAPLTDLHWADFAQQICSGEAVSVPVNPGPWRIELPERSPARAPSAFSSAEARRGAPILNVSVRVTIERASSAHVGFIVGGTKERRVLVRAIGPSLGQFGVARTVAHPQIKVRRGDEIIEAAGGVDAASLAAVTAAVGGFQLLAGKGEATTLLLLKPGTYTAIFSGDPDDAGDLLGEVYLVE